MPRVMMNEQPEYEFTYHVTVQARDVNSTEHLDHKVLMAMIQDARTNILHDLGLKESSIDNGHVGVILADIAINYRAEVFAFEKLTVESHYGEFDEKSFRIHFRIRKDGGRCLVALIEAGFVVYDYLNRSVTRMPESFPAAIAAAGRQALNVGHIVTGGRYESGTGKENSDV